MLKKIEKLFNQQCDGDWEHEYGIKIETLDNPGWNVKIDLTNLNKKIPNVEWKLYENSENDWYGYKINDNCFEASGDVFKLEFLINLFFNVVKIDNI